MLHGWWEGARGERHVYDAGDGRTQDVEQLFQKFGWDRINMARFNIGAELLS